MSYTPSFPHGSIYTTSSASTPPPPPPKPITAPIKPSSSTDYSTAPPPPPPRPQSQYDTSINKYDHPPAPPDQPSMASGLREPQTQQQPYQPHPQPHTQPPRVEDQWLPQLLHTMPKPQLQDLLANPSLQQALLLSPSTTHPSLPASLETLDTALAQNTALAASTMPLLEHLLQTRAQVAHRLLEAKALEQSFRHKTITVESALQPFSPQALHARLVQAINEQEGICKGVEESFIEGGNGPASEREVESWMREVRREREVLGMRKARRERWDEGRVGGWR